MWRGQDSPYSLAVDQGTIEPQQSVTLMIGAKTLEPRFGGNLDDELLIETDLGPRRVVLTQRAAAPALEVATPVDFARTRLTQRSAAQTVVVTNRGLVASNVMLAGGAEFASSGAGLTVPPGASVPIPVEFAPRELGVRTHAIEIAASPSACSEVTGAFRGEGFARATSMISTPNRACMMIDGGHVACIASWETAATLLDRDLVGVGLRVLDDPERFCVTATSVPTRCWDFVNVTPREVAPAPFDPVTIVRPYALLSNGSVLHAATYGGPETSNWPTLSAGGVKTMSSNVVFADGHVEDWSRDVGYSASGPFPLARTRWGSIDNATNAMGTSGAGCALLATGSVVCRETSDVPFAPIAGITDATSIAQSELTRCASTASGSVARWGAGLMLYSLGSVPSQRTVTFDLGLTAITRITATFANIFFGLTSDGRVVSWDTGHAARPLGFVKGLD